MPEYFRRPLICSISIFERPPLVPAMSTVPLSNELVAWALHVFPQTVSQTSWQNHPMQGVGGTTSLGTSKSQRWVCN